MRPRGRPKRIDIAALILQGMKSQSRNQCKICKRTFPRMKNLNTHFSTHSDEKKYSCDFPDCTKCFKQSSQLKNHLLLHSKEKPFICPAEGCLARYTHSGRICQSHSGLKLIKQPETAEEIQQRFYRNVENVPEADKKWFEEYLSKRARKLPPASVNKRFDDVESLQEIHEDSIIKVSDSEEDISQDSIMKVSDSEEDISQGGIMKVSDSEEDISEGGIMKVSDSEEDISEDGIMKVSDSEEDISEEDISEEDISEEDISEEDISEDGIMKVSDSEEDISQDGIMKVSDSKEEIHQDKNMLQEIQDGLLFYSFLKDLCKKGGDSKALFKKSCRAVIIPN